ncbi:MAG: rhodanese-like domain-containing protein [Bacteroidetes bacterium]|nr:rhodanese-like domain-containing protein [Bacteroidota bacterium]MBS1981416.1 rhodanese-like domain-containing protein [Bacteroidota bacterium]
MIQSVFFISLIFLSLTTFGQQQKDPWSALQLMEPENLAQVMNDPKAHQPVILCVGPAATIKNSIEIGPAKELANVANLTHYLKNIAKDEIVVLYCGCCPFDRCPNVRPAFEALNKMGFKNHRLLNLAHNLKVDWIDHGYPVNE